MIGLLCILAVLLAVALEPATAAAETQATFRPSAAEPGRQVSAGSARFAQKRARARLRWASSRGAAGSIVRLRGKHLPPNRRVRIRFGSLKLEGGRTGRNGRYQRGITVPRLTPGVYRVKVRVGRARLSFTFRVITLVANGLAPVGPGGPGGVLGVTSGGSAAGSGPHGPQGPPADRTAPAPPRSLTARDGDGRVTLDWADVAEAVGYRVYRRTDTGSWPSSPIASTTRSDYVDTGVTNGNRYAYRVTAYDGASPPNESAPSVPVNAAPQATPPDPPDPPGPQPSGANFYVDSEAGDDSRAGTSEGEAWMTLERATQAALGAGDRVLLRRGRTWSGALKVTASGSSESPILVSAYGEGDPPLITGGCVDLHGDHIEVRNIHVDNCAWSGIDIYGAGNTVRQSRVTHNVAGIFVRPGANDSQLIGNELEDNNRMSVLTQTPTDDDSGAFGILLQGDGTRVSGNRITGSNAFSYDYGTDGAAIEVFGGKNSRITRNVALDNETFSELGESGAVNNVYSFNVVRSSLPATKFLVTRGSESGWGPVLQTVLYNNSVVLDGTGSEGLICYGGCGTGILTMRNNIIHAEKIGFADARFDEDHNIYLAAKPPSFEIGSNTILADPQFRDLAAGDLRLRSSSPGIDSGVDVGMTRDFDLASAIQDGNGDGTAAPDPGAFEYSPAN